MAGDRSWTTLMSENFEGAFPAGLWDVFDDDGATHGEFFWDDDDYLPHNGSRSAWAAKGGTTGSIRPSGTTPTTPTPGWSTAPST